MKLLKKLYYKIFPTYTERDEGLYGYLEADQMISDSINSEDSEQWELSKLEDGNLTIGYVWLCKKTRVIE